MVTHATAAADLLARSTTAGWRPGTVGAIDAATGTLTLRLSDGEVVDGVPWQASAYTPIVGDRVVVTWDRGAGMLVTGTLSTVRTETPEQVRVEVGPAETVTAELWPDGTWEWGTPESYPPGFPYMLRQGVFYSTSTLHGGPGMRQPSTLIRYPAVTAPAGATDVTLALRVSRDFTLKAADGTILAPPTVSPVLHAHAYNPLPAGTGAPVPAPGLDVWRPGPLAQGETAYYPLPTDWAAALLAGTITGWYSQSDLAEDYTTFIGDANLHLVLTYTPPPEEA